MVRGIASRPMLAGGFTRCHRSLAQLFLAQQVVDPLRVFLRQRRPARRAIIEPVLEASGVIALIQESLEIDNNIRIVAKERHKETCQTFGYRHGPRMKRILPAALGKANERIPAGFGKPVARHTGCMFSGPQEIDFNEMRCAPEQFRLLLEV